MNIDFQLHNQKLKIQKNSKENFYIGVQYWLMLIVDFVFESRRRRRSKRVTHKNVIVNNNSIIDFVLHNMFYIGQRRCLISGGYLYKRIAKFPSNRYWCVKYLNILFTISSKQRLIPAYYFVSDKKYKTIFIYFTYKLFQ